MFEELTNILVEIRDLMKELKTFFHNKPQNDYRTNNNRIDIFLSLIDDNKKYHYNSLRDFLGKEIASEITPISLGLNSKNKYYYKGSDIKMHFSKPIASYDKLPVTERKKILSMLQNKFNISLNNDFETIDNLLCNQTLKIIKTDNCYSFKDSKFVIEQINIFIKNNKKVA